LIKGVINTFFGEVFDPDCEVSDLHEILVYLVLLVLECASQPAYVDSPYDANDCIAADANIGKLGPLHRPKMVQVHSGDIAIVLQKECIIRKIEGCNRARALILSQTLGNVSASEWQSPIDFAELLAFAICDKAQLIGVENVELAECVFEVFSCPASILFPGNAVFIDTSDNARLAEHFDFLLP